jgi:hypothetical protein
MAFVSTALSCVVRATAVPPPEGTLTVLWTVDGTTDPEACYYHGADSLDLAVYHGDGYLAADPLPPCEVFDVSVDLSPGYYAAEMTLVDDRGYPVSSTLVIDVHVHDDREVIVDVDFGPSSML